MQKHAHTKVPDPWVLLQERQVQKLYKVLSRGSRPMEGHHVHYMYPSRCPPRIVSAGQLVNDDRHSFSNCFNGFQIFLC